MKRDAGGIVLAISVVISLMASSAVIVYSMGGGEETESPPDMQPFIGSLASLTRGSMNAFSNRSAASAGAALRESLPAWVEMSDPLIRGYTAVLKESSVNVTEIKIPAGIPLPPPNIEKDDGGISPNSLMLGSTGSWPVIPCIRTEVRMELELIPSDGSGEGMARTVSFSVNTVDPERALDALISLMEKDSGGWYSGLARDVEYMLNALVRSRVKMKVGTSFTDTYLHLLNEGDVELAVNLAIAYRIFRWTGSKPVTLTEEVDSFFSDQMPEAVMNPSGARQWGEAEKDNFNDYISRSHGETRRRSITDMMSIIEDFSHTDPADLFLRYLYMDRVSGGNMDPLDLEGPLEENRLLNPRQPGDRVDPFALEHHTRYPDSRGIRIETLPGTPDDRDMIIPEMDTRYIVSGRDLSVSGIHSFDALYTNANLSFTDSDLVAYGNSSFSNLSTVTRCGAIPPPTKPPSHDYRIEWNLELEGSYRLNATNRGWSGSDPFPGYVDRKISFSFPVRIFTGTGRLFDENFPGLRNINTGRQFYTPISTGWVITPVANATEFFESLVWQKLRGAFQPLTSLARTAGWSLDMTEGADRRIRMHAAAMGALSSLEEWNSAYGSGTRTLMYDLYLNNIKRPGIDPGDIGPIIIDGHRLSISYSPSRDRMEITSHLPEGSVTFRLWPLSGGELKTDAVLHLSPEVRMELDISDGTFTLFGSMDGMEVSEGSSIPRAPDDDVWKMLGEGTALYSASFERNISSPVSLFSGPDRIPNSIDGNASIRILVRGDVDMERILNDPIREEDPLSCLVDLAERYEGEDVYLGVMARIRTSAGELERSMIFTPMTVDMLPDLVSSGSMNIMMNALVSTTNVASLRISGTDMLIVESAPFPAAGMRDSSMPLLSAVIHFRENGDAGINYFNTVWHDAPDGGWSIVNENAPSPLW